MQRIGTESDQPQSAPGPDRLSGAPDCVIHHAANWLVQKEMLSLMQASKRHHLLVNHYYENRLVPVTPPPAHPARAYCTVPLRMARYIPTDHAGREMLARLAGIQFPLTARMQTGQLSLQQALQAVSDRQKIIDSTLRSTSLSVRQKDMLTNRLFAEHVLCDRCDIDTAIRLSKNCLNLFYSLTLQSLFRAGELAPADLETISEAGLRLLHDPLLCKLYLKGILSKEVVLGLTHTQFDALLICYSLLNNRQLGSTPVLALTGRQIKAMRASGQLDDLQAGHTTLAHVLQRGQRRPGTQDNERTDSASPGAPRQSAKSVLSHPGFLRQHERLHLVPGQVYKVSDSLFNDRGRAWLTELGKAVRPLNASDIIQLLDSSNGDNLTSFESFNNGLATKGAEKAARIYLQIYIDLARHLNAHDYLRVVQPLLNNVLSWMVSDSCRNNCPAIIDQCCQIWSLVRSKCVLCGTDSELLKNALLPEFVRRCGDLEYGDVSAGASCLVSFGRLLKVMEMLDDKSFFRAWIAFYEEPSVGADIRRLDCYQAVYSPFSHTVLGADFWDRLASVIRQRRAGVA